MESNPCIVGQYYGCDICECDLYVKIYGMPFTAYMCWEILYSLKNRLRPDSRMIRCKMGVSLYTNVDLQSEIKCHNDSWSQEGVVLQHKTKPITGDYSTCTCISVLISLV